MEEEEEEEDGSGVIRRLTRGSREKTTFDSWKIIKMNDIGMTFPSSCFRSQIHDF